MAQFDVFVRRGGPGFLVDCQGGVASALEYALRRARAAQAVRLPTGGTTQSCVSNRGAKCRADAAECSHGVDAGTGSPIGSFAEHRHAIMNALDMLLTGT